MPAVNTPLGNIASPAVSDVNSKEIAISQTVPVIVHAMDVDFKE